jgi:hypothetical protein
MNSHIYQKRVIRLNRLIKKWGVSDKSVQKKIIKEIVNQYLAVKRAEFEDHLQWGIAQRSEFDSHQFEQLIHWVTVKPIIKLAKEGIEHLNNKRFDKVREIFEELSNDKKLTSTIKSSIRKSKKRREHPLNTLIAAELQKDENATLTQVTRRLRAQEGKGVITQWDNETEESDNYIYTKYPDGKEAPKAKVTGLKERYYDVFNKK